MMSYGSEIFFGGSDNVLEWDKPGCIFKFEKKFFLNDPNRHVPNIHSVGQFISSILFPLLVNLPFGWIRSTKESGMDLLTNFISGYGVLYNKSTNEK